MWNITFFLMMTCLPWQSITKMRTILLFPFNIKNLPLRTQKRLATSPDFKWETSMINLFFFLKTFSLNNIFDFQLKNCWIKVQALSTISTQFWNSNQSHIMLYVIIWLSLLSFLGKSRREKNNFSDIIKDIATPSHSFIHLCLPE